MNLRPHVRNLLLLTLVIPLAGCASAPTVHPAHYPFTAENWNGIDNVEFLAGIHLRDYSQLVMEPIDTSSTPTPPLGDNTYAPVVEMLGRMDGILARQAGIGLDGKLAVTTNKPERLEKALLFRGEVMEIVPGSRAARFWVGFGAGSAWVRIHGVIVDAQSGNPLVRFTQRNVAAWGGFGESYETVLTRCVEGIGRDMGRLLNTFKD